MKFFFDWVQEKIQTFFNLLFPYFHLVVFKTNDINLVRKFYLFLSSQKIINLVLVGSGSDGSYYLPSFYTKVEAVISAGYGGKKDFEDKFSELYIPSFILDPDYVELTNQKENQFFYPVALSSNSNLANEVNLSNFLKRIDKLDSTSLLLKIDIEGNEFKILSTVSKEILEKFAILVIEFHNLEELFVSRARQSEVKEILQLFENYVNIFSKANNCGGQFSYLGINFPRIVEVSLLRNDWFNKNKFEKLNNYEIVPFKNCPNRKQIYLPKFDELEGMYLPNGKLSRKVKK